MLGFNASKLRHLNRSILRNLIPSHACKVIHSGFNRAPLDNGVTPYATWNTKLYIIFINLYKQVVARYGNQTPREEKGRISGIL